MPLFAQESETRLHRALVDTIFLIQRMLALSFGRTHWIKSSMAKTPTSRYALPINNGVDHDIVQETHKLFGILILLTEHFVPDGLRLVHRKRDLSTRVQNTTAESDDSDTNTDSDSDSDSDAAHVERCAWKKIATNVKFHCELGGNREIFDILFEYLQHQVNCAKLLENWTMASGIVVDLFDFSMIKYKPLRTEDTTQYLKEMLIVTTAKRIALAPRQTLAGLRWSEFVRENPTCPDGLQRWMESMSHNGTKDIELSQSCVLESRMVQALLKDNQTTSRLMKLPSTTLMNLLTAYTDMSEDQGNSREPLFFTDTTGSTEVPIANRIQQYIAELKSAPTPDVDDYNSDASSVDSQPETKRVRTT